jgi:hypothetical protein
MTAPIRTGFRRLEHDAELRARILVREPRAQQLSFETLDAFAERYGLERRIVDDAGPPEVRR